MFLIKMLHFTNGTGKLFRPSNGTTGEIFMDAFCHKCAKHEDGCDILLATLFYGTDDACYPKEWHYNKEGYPICEAFVSKMAQRDLESEWQHAADGADVGVSYVSWLEGKVKP